MRVLPPGVARRRFRARGPRVNMLGPAVDRHVAMARDAASRRARPKAAARTRAGRDATVLRARDARPRSPTMLQALLVSAGTVALAEIGDKTQLLALLLAARFRRPWPIVAGILVATLLNHALAGWLARWSRTGSRRRCCAGCGRELHRHRARTLKPDRWTRRRALPGGNVCRDRGGAFFPPRSATKTQVATVLLATRFDALWQVVAGTTLGMLLANAGGGVRQPLRATPAARGAHGRRWCSSRSACGPQSRHRLSRSAGAPGGCAGCGRHGTGDGTARHLPLAEGPGRGRCSSAPDET